MGLEAYYKLPKTFITSAHSSLMVILSKPPNTLKLSTETNPGQAGVERPCFLMVKSAFLLKVFLLSKILANWSISKLSKQASSHLRTVAYTAHQKRGRGQGFVVPQWSLITIVRCGQSQRLTCTVKPLMGGVQGPALGHLVGSRGKYPGNSIVLAF